MGEAAIQGRYGHGPEERMRFWGSRRLERPELGDGYRAEHGVVEFLGRHDGLDGVNGWWFGIG